MVHIADISGLCFPKPAPAIVVWNQKPRSVAAWRSHRTVGMHFDFEKILSFPCQGCGGGECRNQMENNGSFRDLAMPVRQTHALHR